MSTNILIWRLFCIGGCAALVFGLGHNPWWFLLALMMAF